MNEQPPPNKAKPTRLRFGLRSLLVGITFISILFGCLWDFWWLPSQQQRKAVEQIDSRNGYGDGGVEYGDYQYEPMDNFPFWKTKLAQWFGKDSVTRVTVAFSDGTGAPIDISPWEGLKRVERVGFDHAIVDDLSVLRNFKGLKHFSVFQSGDPAPPGKAGLEVLGDAPYLETVKLHESGFTFNDMVFESICNARTIRHFEFASEGLTDLSPLGNLKQLEELYIFSYCKDAIPPSLSVIGKFPKLKKLTLHLNWIPDDFAFLKSLQTLESCLITGELSEDAQAEIQSHLPDDCEVKFKY